MQEIETLLINNNFIIYRTNHIEQTYKCIKTNCHNSKFVTISFLFAVQQIVPKYLNSLASPQGTAVETQNFFTFVELQHRMLLSQRELFLLILENSWHLNGGRISLFAKILLQHLSDFLL